MKAHNRNKILRNGNYISKAEDALYKGLTVVACVSLLTIFISPLIVRSGVSHAQEEIPLVSANPRPIQIVEVEKPLQIDEMSLYIDEAVSEFLPTHKSESLMIMHCLAHRENGHAASDKCGDSGLACGPFQFHQETWVRMRKQMIKAGFASEIGDRYDKKQSARTTAWAISNGNAREWGPINRDSKGNDYAACQTPSWYKEDYATK